MMSKTVADWLENRVTLLTGKGTAELKELGEEMNSRAFFVSKLSVAAVANPLREISNDYTLGKITLSEAQGRLRELGSGSTDAIARSLANRSRATQVLNTQRQMARGVAEWKSWQDDKEDFPCLIYRANRDGFVRPSHLELDGKVFYVDDPFLQTHMPGKWDYNCRCRGEQVTRKRAEREAAKTGGIQPRGEATFDAESGFMFDPANAFVNDTTQLKDRAEVVADMADCVRRGEIRKMGMIVASPGEKFERASLPGLDRMTEAMRQIQPLAQESADKAGWDPKLLPSFTKQADKYRENNPAEKDKLPEAIKKAFPGEIELGKITGETCRQAGLADVDVPITLSVGDQSHGLTHDWQHHKGEFVNPKEGERIIRATLGNPKAQVSVTFEKMDRGVRKVITFYDPKTKSYSVAKYDEGAQKFQLMSWHRSPASYGEGQWEVRGMPKPKLDDQGNPVLTEKGKPEMVSDLDRKKAHYRRQHERKK